MIHDFMCPNTGVACTSTSCAPGQQTCIPMAVCPNCGVGASVEALEDALNSARIAESEVPS